MPFISCRPFFIYLRILVGKIFHFPSLRFLYLSISVALFCISLFCSCAHSRSSPPINTVNKQKQHEKEMFRNVISCICLGLCVNLMQRILSAHECFFLLSTFYPIPRTSNSIVLYILACAVCVYNNIIQIYCV